MSGGGKAEDNDGNASERDLHRSLVIHESQTQEQDGMATLGPIGVLRETFSLCRAHPKILLQITILQVPWSSVAVIALLLPPPTLIPPSFRPSDAPAVDTTVPVRALSFWLLLVICPVLEFLLLSVNYAAIFHFVGCTYSGKSVAFSEVLRAVARLWKRVTLTDFYCSSPSIAFSIVFTGVSISLAALADKLPYELVMIAALVLIIIMLVLVIVIMVFLVIIAPLAIAVSSLEDSYGWAAIGKSLRLTKGKRWTTVVVVLLVQVPFPLLVLLKPALVSGRLWQVVLVPALLIVYCSFFGLVNILSTGVLYVSCKAYHDERIDYFFHRGPQAYGEE